MAEQHAVELVLPRKLGTERLMSAELFDRRKGDQLRSELLGDPEAFGAKANALVAEFWQGYPLDELRSLLHCNNDEVARAAIYIASELE